jgi:hypothetical protein
MKKCCTCKKIKPVSDFYKNRATKDGFDSTCNLCRKEYHQNSEYKKYQKKYIKIYQCTEKFKQWRLEYKRNHREKINAQIVVSVAVRNGKLPKISTMKCSNCQNQAKHYHHHKGYNKEHQLDVIPVCYKCHKILHCIGK